MASLRHCNRSSLLRPMILGVRDFDGPAFVALRCQDAHQQHVSTSRLFSATDSSTLYKGGTVATERLMVGLPTG